MKLLAIPAMLMGLPAYQHLSVPRADVLALSVPHESSAAEAPRMLGAMDISSWTKYLPPVAVPRGDDDAAPTHTSARSPAPHSCSAGLADPNGGAPSCSVGARDPNGSTCSTGGGPNNVCSAEGATAGGLFCSVTWAPPNSCSVVHKGGTQNYCSAQGAANTRCSVDMFGLCSITKSAPPGAGWENKCTAFTSADGTSAAKCSAFNPNPSSLDAFCSIISTPAEPATNALCTVLQQHSDDPLAGPECSAFTPAGVPHAPPQSICSALINGTFYPPEAWPDHICKSVAPQY